MKIINGCRRSGKTYKMLEQMTCRDVFVTASMQQCRIAYEDWIVIHKPKYKDYNFPYVKQDVRPTFVTYRDFFATDVRGFRFDNVYIDNLDEYIEYIASLINVKGSVVCTTKSVIEELPVSEDVKEMIAKYGSKDILPEEKMTEDAKLKNRAHWLNVIKSANEKLKPANPSCEYNLSRKEVSTIMVALAELREGFFDGSDCTKLIKKLQKKSNLKGKDLKILEELEK